MKIRTFWLILLKIIGISLVISGVNVIRYSLATFLMVGNDPVENSIFILLSIISILLTVAIYFFILWLFVFKTSWLVDKLRLEKDFEEKKIEINTQLSSILSIAIVVIGGIMIIRSLPQLCKEIFTFFQMKSTWQESRTTGWIILYLVEAVLGYLLMTNSKQVTAFIHKHSHTDKENE